MGGVEGASEARSRDDAWRIEQDDKATREAERKNGRTAAELPWANDFAAIASPPAGPINLTPIAAPPPTPTAAGPVDPAVAAKVAQVVHPERSFSDFKSLTVEIFRLKSEAAKKPDAAVASALRMRMRIAMLQSQWIDMATKAGIPKPTARLDPVNAKAGDIASALLWHEAGGVVPASELAADGGKAFDTSIRDAVTRQTQGFDAMLALHRGQPEEQKALLRSDLKRLGDTTPADPADSIYTLSTRRDGLVANRKSEQVQADLATEQQEQKRLYMGLDGFVGTAESLERYERTEKLKASVSDTTAGSILASYFGGGDVQKMRSLGELGSAAEGVAGGAAVVIEGNRREKVEPKEGPAAGRPAPKSVKDIVGEELAGGAPVARSGPPAGPNTLVISAPTRPTAPVMSAPNRSTAPVVSMPTRPTAPVVSQPSRPTTPSTTSVGRVEPFSSSAGTFATKPMKTQYAGEHVPGNTAWPGQTVSYCQTRQDRAQYKLEMREVEINGKREVRIFDADGNLFDTRAAQTWNGSPKAIFVMNADGEIFASRYQERGVFHHSSLAGGQPVAAAGELTVIDGKIVEVSNRSGHYMPDASFTDQLIASLRSKGISTAGVTVVDAATNQKRVLQ